MKKLLALALVAATSVSAFTSCGKDEEATKSGATDNKNPSEVQENNPIPEDPDEYLEYVLLTNSGISEFGKAIDVLKSTESASESGDIVLSVGEGTKEFISAINSQAGVMYDMFAWFKSAEISYDTDIKDDNLVRIIANLGLNNTNIVSADIAASLEDSKFYLTIPELSEKTLYAEIPDVPDVTPAYMKYLPEGDAAERIINRYIGIFLDELAEVEKSEFTMSVGNVSENVTKLYTEIDSATSTDISIAMLESVITDEDIKSIITKVSDNNHKNVGFSSSEEMTNAAYEGMQKALDNLKNSEPKESDKAVGLSVYADSDHNITGYEVSFDGKEFLKFNYAENNGSFAMVLASNNSEIIRARGTVSNNKMSGTAEILGGNGVHAVYITLSDIDLELLEKDMLNGTVSIKLAESVLDLVEYGDILANCELAFTFSQTTADASSVCIRLNYNNKKAIGLDISSRLKAAGSISLPEGDVDMLDEDSFSEYAASVSTDKLIKNLNDAGANSIATLLQLALVN